MRFHIKFRCFTPLEQRSIAWFQAEHLLAERDKALIVFYENDGDFSGW